MNKKQLISLAGLALGVTLLATPTFADTNTAAGWGASEDGKTDVTVTVAPNYTITIPASFSFTAANVNTVQNEKVSISKDSQLNENGSLAVSMTSTLAATKTYGLNTSTIPFTLAYGTSGSQTNYASGSVAILTKTGAEIGAASADLEETVSVNVPTLTGATIAGAHAGTVDFSVAYTAGS